MGKERREKGMFSAIACRRVLIPAARGYCAAPKVTTNLVGLDVVPNAPEVLTEMYTKTLEEEKALPASAGYRVNVEKVTNYRLKVVAGAEGSIDAIESEMGLQVEEMIVEAEKELELMPQMAEWKPWEATAPAAEQH